MAIQTRADEALLALVRSWPAAQRVTFVQALLGIRAPIAHQPHQTLTRARGVLATDQDPPTDQQVSAWMHERRVARSHHCS